MGVKKTSRETAVTTAPVADNCNYIIIKKKKQRTIAAMKSIQAVYKLPLASFSPTSV